MRLVRALPLPAYQLSQTRGGRSLGAETRDALDHLHPFLPRFLIHAVTAPLKDLCETRPIALAYQSLTRRDMARLDASMADGHRPRGLLTVAHRRERQDQRDSGPQLRLMLFDCHDIITTRVPHGLGSMPLGAQRIHRDSPVLQNELAQHGLDLCARIGLIVHCLWGERQAQAMGQSRQHMDARRALLTRAPQRFASESDGGFARRGSRREADDDLLSPGAQCRFPCVTLHMPKPRVQRRCTGGVVGKAQRLGDTGALIVPPCGHGTRATGATQPRTAGQREHGRQGMALAPTVAKVGNLGEDLDEGLRLGYQKSLP
jgi:hypothetical protein